MTHRAVTTAVRVVRARVGTGGYGYWVGTGEGLYRVLPTHRPAARGDLDLTAKRAPEALQGLEWVVRARSGVRLQNPPFGPGRYGSLVLDPPRADTRLLANKGEN